MGMTTGKFNRETVFPDNDVRHSWDMQAERPLRYLERVETIRKMFTDLGDDRTLAQIALAWVWSRNERTIPIPGFKTLTQVQENIQAMDYRLLTEEQMKKIDEVFERPSVP